MDVYKIMTNPFLKEYDLFHDRDWAKAVQGPQTNKEIENALFVLNIVWFKHSNMFNLPVKFMEAMKSVSDGILDTKTRGMIHLFRVFKQKLSQYDLTHTKRNEIIGDLNKIENDLEEIYRDTSDYLDHEKFFSYMHQLDQMGFGSGLASLIEQTFCGVYFAYDDFVRRCFWALGVTPAKRKLYTSSREFATTLEQQLNDASVFKDCWTCDEVKLAKEARSLVAHSSGIYHTDTYTEYGDYYEIDKPHKQILIHAAGVRKLYGNLKVRAEKLYKHVLKLKPTI
ncbi:MAG TPA: hypothetical protein PLN21_21135 [Gemmatales bacterium]|nr:hypothetical protein [Gemmatales bacterium]